MLALVIQAGRRVAAALAYRDFRLLWLGALASSIGTWMQKVAQAWLIVTLDRHHLSVFPRARFVSRRSAHPPLHAHRRRRRGPPRSPSHDADVAVHPDDDGVHAGDSGLHRPRAHLAHPRALVHERHRAVVRRTGVSVADSVADSERAPAQRDRAQFDPVQSRPRDWTARGRRGPHRVRHGRVLRPERRVVPLRDRRHPRAARDAHAVHRAPTASAIS